MNELTRKLGRVANACPTLMASHETRACDITRVAVDVTVAVLRDSDDVERRSLQ